MKARTLDGAYVNKYVRSTVVRLNKAKAFLAVEPLHNTRCHYPSPTILTNALLPTIHVSKFDPAMSWGGKALRAWPSRQPDNSNVVTLSAFGKLTQEQYQNGAGGRGRGLPRFYWPVLHLPLRGDRDIGARRSCALVRGNRFSHSRGNQALSKLCRTLRPTLLTAMSTVPNAACASATRRAT